MADTQIKPITSGYNVSKINDNFDNIQSKIDDTLISSKDGQNVMFQDLDLNNQSILNGNILNVKGLTINGTAVSPTDLGSLGPNTVATTNIVDGSVTDSKILSISGSKASYQQLGTGAVLKNLQDKARERISVKDFGAKGDGVTDDTAAFIAAIASVALIQTVRGADIYVPHGQYILTDTLYFTSYTPDNAINIRLVGDGFLSTWLDFSTMTGSKDAIVISGDQQVAMRGFYLKGGPSMRDGIHLGRNLAEGGAQNNAVSMFDITDVRVQGCGRDGIHHYNSYMGLMTRVYALANGRDGFHGDGFHTSLSHHTCYALNNSASGFNYNGIVYSNFIGCGSDLNQFGYSLSNARGVSFKSCGAEGNKQDGWLIFADQGTVDTTNPLMVQECYDIHGVSLDNCSGYSNNQFNAGYAGLVRLVANNVHSGSGTFNDGSPHKVDVTINSSDANSNPSGTKAIVTQQTLGGQVKYTEAGSCYFPGARTLGTGTTRRDMSLLGKSCILTLNTAQSIPTSVNTSINWAVSSDDIGGCWSAGTPNIITIPQSLDGLKVIVKFQAAWAADNTGARQAQVYKNGAYTSPMPFTAYGESDFYSACSYGASPPVKVLAGDTFQLVVQHNTASNLNFSATLSYLSIEVVG